MSAESLVEWVHKHNGVAHSSVIRAAGFSDYSLKRAVSKGELRRVRRSWLATPDCDAERLAAAQVGGRVTCVTAAAQMGLWAIDTPLTHVAVPRTASRLERTALQIHTAQGPVPVAACATEEPVLNVLFHVARCLPQADALAIWESAIRRDFIDADVLEQVKWRSHAASGILRLTGSRSDSGLETQFLVLMREIGVEVRQQFWVDGHPLDALIGDRLGVQIDGFAHHSSTRDRRRDIRADARLALRGYTMLRFDAYQLNNQRKYVQQTVLTALAQGLHLAPENRQ